MYAVSSSNLLYISPLLSRTMHALRPEWLKEGRNEEALKRTLTWSRDNMQNAGPVQKTEIFRHTRPFAEGIYRLFLCYTDIHSVPTTVPSFTPVHVGQKTRLRRFAKYLSSKSLISLSRPFQQQSRSYGHTASLLCQSTVVRPLVDVPQLDLFV